MTFNSVYRKQMIRVQSGTNSFYKGKVASHIERYLQEVYLVNTVPLISEDLLRMRFIGTPVLSLQGNEVVWVETTVLDDDNSYTSVIMHKQGDKTSALSNRGGRSKGKDYAPLFSPDGSQLAFLSDRDGKAGIWLMSKGYGEAVSVTTCPKPVLSFVWDHTGQGIFFVTKDVVEQPTFRAGATARRITRLRYKFNGVGYYDDLYTQIYYLNLSDKSVTKLTSGPHNASQPAPSPCGRFLAFCSNRNTDELKTLEDIYILNLQDKSLRNLTNGVGPSRKPMWSGDHSIMYIGHEKGSYPGAYPELREIDINTGVSTNLMPDFPHYLGNTIGTDARFDGGSAEPRLSTDGSQVYFVATAGGNSYLYAVRRVDGKVAHVYGEGQMCITSFNEAQGKVVANVSTPKDIGNLHLLMGSGKWEQVTQANSELLSHKYVGWPDAVHFTHGDGTVLEGWIIKPYGFKAGEKYPLIMEIHGGPHSTYGNAFSHEFQMLAGAGFGVLYTNPRGSLGYGEGFARACVGDWCGVDAADLQLMAEQTVAQTPWVDSARVGVTGGSQGGYFTNWLIGHTDMFKAAVTQRSMSNLYSKYGVSDIGWSGDRHGMGGKDLWVDEDFIMERSPIRYAPQVKTPTLIIHSDQDYRCPLEQAEQWYVALKRLGVPAEMLLFHGENHELSRSGKPANRLVRLDAILEWFNRYL